MTETILTKRRSGSADSWLVHPINRRDQLSPETAAIAVGWAYSPSSLILLCHKFRCLFRAAQHGQRESVVARAATNLRRIVAIEFGTWRSGRNGGSSGLVTFAYGNLRAQRGGTIS